jgi:hypothetical protein
MCVVDCAVERVNAPGGIGGYEVLASGGRGFGIGFFADESVEKTKLVLGL